MSLSESLYSILKDIFSGEFYPVVHPDSEGKEDDVAETYAIFTIIGGATFHKLGGIDDLKRPRVQISIYSIDYDDLKLKEEAVAASMKAANLISDAAIDDGNDPLDVEGGLVNVLIAVPTDDYEKETKRFYSHSEFYCWIRS